MEKTLQMPHIAEIFAKDRVTYGRFTLPDGTAAVRFGWLSGAGCPLEFIARGETEKEIEKEIEKCARTFSIDEFISELSDDPDIPDDADLLTAGRQVKDRLMKLAESCREAVEE